MLHALHLGLNQRVLNYFQSASQDMKHEKEAELEIIKTLRKNWVPPEETIADVAQTKLEPKKLQIAHVYGNDSRDGPEKFKQLRQSELEEIRQSAPLAVRWQTEETGDTNKVYCYNSQNLILAIISFLGGK